MANQNVFLEFGFPADEATAKKWRADFARIIREEFRSSGLTQNEFGKRAQLKQSYVSQIINAETEAISVEFLLKACIRLGIPGVAKWSADGKEVCVIADRTSESFKTSVGQSCGADFYDESNDECRWVI